MTHLLLALYHLAYGLAIGYALWFTIWGKRRCAK